MTQNLRPLLLASVACAALSGAANAQQTEFIGIINGAANDSTYAQGSLRFGVNGTLDDGMLLRFDIARGMYEFEVGATTVDGTVDTTRLLVGYVMPMGAQKVTLWGGLSYRDRDNDPLVGALENESETGLFLAAEYFGEMSNADVFALAEYDSAFQTFYTGGYAVWDLGGIMVGPTANYVHEEDYERYAFGVRMQAALSDSVELVLTGAWAEGGVNDNHEDSSYVELQLSTQF